MRARNVASERFEQVVCVSGRWSAGGNLQNVDHALERDEQAAQQELGKDEGWHD
jgi:hypothetical protein